MSIIGISGKIGSGKDTVADIFRMLITKNNYKEFQDNEHTLDNYLDVEEERKIELSGWEVKKFADKLKDIVCLLLNCTREELEDREFKEKELGEEWRVYIKQYHSNHTERYIISKNYYDTFKNNKEAQIKNCYNLKTYILTPRKILQLLGTEAGREIIHPNIWVNSLMSEYKYEDKNSYFKRLTSMSRIEWKQYNPEDYKRLNEIYFKSIPNWLITDMRFPNELKAVKDKGGITIRINRFKKCTCTNIGDAENCNKFCTEQPINEHPSETALDNAEFDYIIENDSNIQSLIKKVKIILEKEKII